MSVFISFYQLTKFVILASEVGGRLLSVLGFGHGHENIYLYLYVKKWEFFPLYESRETK